MSLPMMMLASRMMTTNGKQSLDERSTTVSDGVDAITHTASTYTDDADDDDTSEGGTLLNAMVFAIAVTAVLIGGAVLIDWLSSIL